jgi:hypothetical protein
MRQLIALIFICSSALVWSEPEKTKESANTNEPAKESSTTSTYNQAIGFGIGQTFLLGDFKDYASNSKLSADLFYLYRASYSFDFLINAHSSSIKGDSGQKIDLKGASFNIKGKLFDFDAFAPYIMGGLGFYFPRATRLNGNTLERTESKMTLGLNMGLGADLQLNERYSFGLLTVYHKPFRLKQETQSSLEGSYFKFMGTFFLFF